MSELIHTTWPCYEHSLLRCSSSIIQSSELESDLQSRNNNRPETRRRAPFIRFLRAFEREGLHEALDVMRQCEIKAVLAILRITTYPPVDGQSRAYQGHYSAWCAIGGWRSE